MRTPLEIVKELKNVTHWSQPNIKFNETMALLNELESVLSPVEPVAKQPKVVIEAPVVEDAVIVEETPVATTTSKKSKK